MKLIAGRVVGGKVEIPPETLAEGESVAVLVPEEESSFRLGADDEAELLDAMEEIRRGEFIDGAELLEEIRSRRGG